MSASGKAVTDGDLQGYVDGALDRFRRTEVDKFLQNNPVVRNELREYQQYNQAFHRMYDSVLQEKMPKRLLNFDTLVKRSRAPLAQVASLAAAVLIGAVLGWVARGEGILPGLAKSKTMVMLEDAFTYHAVYTPEIRHPVEVTGDQQAHLMKWLSKRLRTPVRAPQLTREGFKLLGGRLLTTDRDPAAQFMYENSKGQRVTLFTRLRNQAESNSAFRYASQGNVNGFYWTDGDLTFALIADIPRNQVSQLAHVVYEELNK